MKKTSSVPSLRTAVMKLFIRTDSMPVLTERVSLAPLTPRSAPSAIKRENSLSTDFASPRRGSACDLDFDTVMSTNDKRIVFHQFLKQNHAEEMILFLNHVEFFKYITDEKIRLKEASKIISKFILVTNDQVNLDHKVKEKILNDYKECVENELCVGDLFKHARKKILVEMKEAWWLSFCQSEMAKKIACSPQPGSQIPCEPKRKRGMSFRYTRV